MSSSPTPTLWMGDLEPYMDEFFIMQAFDQMGEPANQVKLIKNKLTGLPAGYCFVDFADAESSHRAMLRLNGKIIPNSQPPKRFKLNSSSHGKESTSPEFSLFIGELTDDVDDYILYSAFAKRYPTCRSAKVVLGSDGRSRGYGFVRFSEETEQQKALIEMQHVTGIGRRPVRVSLATPKRSHLDAVSYSGYYGGYGHYYDTGYYPSDYHNYYSYYAHYQQQGHYDPVGEEDALEEPELGIDVDKYNKEYMEQSEEIFSAMEDSRWNPIDSVESKIPGSDR
ncbi:hypothetical protein CHS0354_037319 [Potamilus streckersoni]|uniref:tRNA selenocysteine-associated protein 1 n=1 Tax=Potamilus streckersoni TaxID=2493646 RepID=A0AAE0TLF0_9BIVA|nr:hypothetical protein CHS0354_037319 [Potamilus streckersoni]